MERLALPEPQYLVDFEVNNETLADYLMVFDDSAFRGETHFAPELDLAPIEPFLRELHGAQQLGYVYSEELRNRPDSIDISYIKDPIVREIERRRLEAWKAHFHEQDHVEPYRTIYLDEDDGVIKASSIIFGEHTRVETDIESLFGARHTPLLSAHRHPDDRLFSTTDWQDIVLDGTTQGGQRILKGGVLLLPTAQVLAIASPRTMFVHYEEYEKFRAKHDLEQSEKGKRIGEIDEQLDEILINSPFRVWKDLYDQYLLSVHGENLSYLKGLYTEAELRAVIDKLFQKTAEEIKNIPHPKDTYKDEVYLLGSERNRLYNQWDWEIIRDVNPVLYLSTDFRHFREFSACKLPVSLPKLD